MITVILQGGLGNQMFQFATAKALALRLDTELILDLSFFNLHKDKAWCRPYGLNVFNHTATIKKNGFNRNKYIIYLFPTLKKYKIGKRILSTLDVYCDDKFQSRKFLSLRNGTTLFGYFPNENFFSQYRNEILSEFSYKETLNNACQQIVDDISLCNAVSIHIRRSDYLNSQFSKIFTHCSVEWYDHSIQYIRNRVDSPVFYFFSDDMEWVKENFSSTENAHFVDINKDSDAYTDMRLMSFCKHNIIANSTFSWWGAWLNLNPDKIVIAPKNYYQDEKKNREKSNIMPESWVLL
jgi:hypothetical protein